MKNLSLRHTYLSFCDFAAVHTNWMVFSSPSQRNKATRWCVGVCLCLLLIGSQTPLFQVSAAGQAASWIQLNPTPDAVYGSPHVLLGAEVYNQATNRLILFGGATDTLGYDLENDVWVLSNADGTGGTPAWTKLTPLSPNGAPSPRELASAGYDQANNRLIVQGGYTTPGSCGGSPSDTWVLTNADGTGAGSSTWIPLTTTGSAPQRRASAASYDAVDNVLIISGGMNGGCGSQTDETWVLTNANGLGTGSSTWTELYPANSSTDASYQIWGTGYNPASNILVAFEINSSGSTYADQARALSNANGQNGSAVWTNVWSTETSSGSPPLTWNPAVVYAASQDSMLLFGGQSNGTALNTVWNLQYASGQGGTPQWTQLQPGGTAPNPRTFSLPGPAQYNSQSNRMIVYGGLNGGTDYFDVWVLTNAMPIQTTTTLGSSLNPSMYGQSVTITATVVQASGPTVPTGTVQFSVDGSPAGSAVTLSGRTATYTTSTLAAGTHSITAVYMPATESVFTASSATALSQTVNQPPPVAATPMFSIPPGVYTSAQTVYLYDPTGGAAIYYTTDGITTPSTGSTPYTGVGIPVSATETILAIAVAPGYSNSAVARATYTIAASSYSLPTEPVGTASATQTATFLLTSSFTLGSISVLTQGAPGPDFTLASGGTCAVGVSYSAGQSCTVNYTFSPTVPGTRLGAIVLFDNTTPTPVVQSTTYLTGTGTGPMTVFYPGMQSVIVDSGLNWPWGEAVDGIGNVYIADTKNNRVLKETLSGGSYTQSVIANSTSNGLSGLAGVAVDAAGNVYIADSYNNRVLKETLSGGSYTQSTVGSGLSSLEGVAVDGVGNVYITDYGYGQVLKETLSGGSYTQSTIVGNGLTNPWGVAVDGAGNVYIADFYNNRVLKETLSSGSYIQSTVGSGLSNPAGVAVDGNGNVYIADTNNGRVLMETLSGGSYTQNVIASVLSQKYDCIVWRVFERWNLLWPSKRRGGIVGYSFG